MHHLLQHWWLILTAALVLLSSPVFASTEPSKEGNVSPEQHPLLPSVVTTQLFPLPHAAAPLALTAPWTGQRSFELTLPETAASGPTLPLKIVLPSNGEPELLLPREVTTEKPPRLFAKREVAENVVTFAEWTKVGTQDRVKAGVSLSLFNRSQWKVSHQMHPFTPGDSAPTQGVTEASVGLKITERSLFRVSGLRDELKSELGSGLFYKPREGMEIGAQARTVRPTSPGEDSTLFPWSNPAVEGNLRLTW